MFHPVARIGRRSGCTAALLVVGGLAVGNTGCGGGSHGASGLRDPRQASASSQPVQSINLHPSDLPTMTEKIPARRLATHEVNTRLAHCSSDLPGWQAGSSLSPRFSAPVSSQTPTPRVELIESAVRILPSEATALEQVASNRASSLRR